ncbi:MAG TPA: alpha/beta hydrolase [Micromonosporaceae bacterium]|nr:alpha/beta hydrolase [Micromonosporaceae bacterium]
MNDVDELKQFAAVHAQLQGVDDGLWRGVLDRIRDDGPGTPGSWVAEWSAAAAELEAQGELLAAAHCYILARFPYVDGPHRREALHRALRAFDAWRAGVPGIERIEVKLDDPAGTLRCWASGLSVTAPRPLLMFTGGIVSLKEQWAPLLMLGEQLGMAVVVGEMPGVGENLLPYRRDSWRMFTAVIDAVADRVVADQAYAIANSFSGHLALRCAAQDRRIRGVISNAAPISDFFTDAAWQARLPSITVATLAHLTGHPVGELGGRLRDWALTGPELSGLEIPVAYCVSRRDEITPPSEAEHLRAHVRHLSIMEFDDVHGSPGHLDETRQWVVGSLLSMRHGA